MVGGCSADNVEYVLTNQFHGTGAAVERLVDSIVAVGLGSNAPIGIGIAHGWAKQGDPMVVTSSDGGEVFLIDDEPALDVYLRRIGAGRSLIDDGDAFRAAVFDHPLGMSRRSGEDIRVVHSADRERGSLLCLADVPQGALVWTMTTGADALVAAAGRSCEMAVDGLGGQPPLGVVVFDCGARKLKLGHDKLSAEQSAIATAAAGAPFGGFYTFGEIARTRGLARDAPFDRREPRAGLIAARPRDEPMSYHWSIHQLTEYLVSVSKPEDPGAAVMVALERAIEAVDAELGGSDHRQRGERECGVRAARRARDLHRRCA